MFLSSKVAFFGWNAVIDQWWVTNSPKFLNYLCGAKFNLPIKDINLLVYTWVLTVWSISWHEVFSSLTIFVAHHWPLWSWCPYTLNFLHLRNLLTVCFLSQQAPSSLLEALEQHLASLEGKKVKDSTAASRYVNPPITISDFLSSFSLSLEAIFFSQCNLKGIHSTNISN